MNIISKILFGIANSLLIPDIILLVILFFRALLLAGSFYSQFTIKRKNDKLLQPLIDKLDINGIENLKKSLPNKNNALVISYLRDMLNKGNDIDYAEYIIGNFENQAKKDLGKSKILTKIGPILGLVGTLIAMSPALVGLSSGDIAGMAYNMQVVFATTVVGLVISGIGLVTLQYKQRWYEKDVNNLLFISRIMQDDER